MPGGGRLTLYVSGQTSVAALVLRWDTPEDAAEWRQATARYVAAAFPGATVSDCPPLDHCWSSSTAEVAAGVFGDTGVLATGPGSEAVAVGLVHLPNSLLEP